MPTTGPLLKRAKVGLRDLLLIPAARRGAEFVETRSSFRTIFARSVGRPNLHELSQLGLLTLDFDDFLVVLLGEAWKKQQAGLIAEHEAIQTAIARRAAAVDLRYPPHYTIEDGTALVLYATIRLTAPNVVIETGVADGRSTATILSAMEHNGSGMLHSVDITADVGVLVTDRTRWKLHVVAPGSSLDPVVESAGPADVFLHDADHSRAGQQRDAAAAQLALRPGGLYLSDDAEWSYVFHDTCRALGKRPVFLLDTRKVFGAVRI